MPAGLAETPWLPGDGIFTTRSTEASFSVSAGLLTHLRELYSNCLICTGHTLERKIVKSSHVFKQKLCASPQMPWADTQDVRFITHLWLHSCGLPPHRSRHEIQHQEALQFCSVQLLSHAWFFVTLWPQHARPPCPSPTPRACSNPCPWVGDAIQPSHPLSSPSPPALNPSQHQGLFQWVSSSNEVAKVLEFQLQHQSFQWTPRTDLL